MSGDPGSAGAARRLAEEAGLLLESLRRAGAATGTHGGPECTVCPICQGVARLRDVRPEAVQHVAAAAVELATALREVFAAPVPPGAAASPDGERPRADPPGSGPVPVQHIEISD